MKLSDVRGLRCVYKRALTKLLEAENLSAEHTPESVKPQIEHTEVASDHVTPASAVHNTHIREVDVSEEMNPDSLAGDTHSIEKKDPDYLNLNSLSIEQILLSMPLEESTSDTSKAIHLSQLAIFLLLIVSIELLN